MLQQLVMTIDVPSVMLEDLTGRTYVAARAVGDKLQLLVMTAMQLCSCFLYDLKYVSCALKACVDVDGSSRRFLFLLLLCLNCLQACGEVAGSHRSPFRQCNRATCICTCCCCCCCLNCLQARAEDALAPYQRLSLFTTTKLSSRCKTTLLLLLLCLNCPQARVEDAGPPHQRLCCSGACCYAAAEAR
jgi:hypothetical protein